MNFFFVDHQEEEDENGCELRTYVDDQVFGGYKVNIIFDSGRKSMNILNPAAAAAVSLGTD